MSGRPFPWGRGGGGGGAGSHWTFGAGGGGFISPAYHGPVAERSLGPVFQSLTTFLSFFYDFACVSSQTHQRHLASPHVIQKGSPQGSPAADLPPPPPTVSRFPSGPSFCAGAFWKCCLCCVKASACPRGCGCACACPTCPYLRRYNIETQRRQAQDNIGYCPQFDALLDYLSVTEHLVLFGRMRGVPKDKLMWAVGDIIAYLGLTPHAHKPSMALSGGNKRKLSIGIAIIGSPDVVFLDEPSSGLDPMARRTLWTCIADVAINRSVILTTHHLEEVDALAHRVTIMSLGRMRCIGSLQHLKSKFGTGYTLQFRIPSDSQAALHKHLAGTFPGIVLQVRLCPRLGPPPRSSAMPLPPPPSVHSPACLCPSLRAVRDDQYFPFFAIGTWNMDGARFGGGTDGGWGATVSIGFVSVTERVFGLFSLRMAQPFLGPSPCPYLRPFQSTWTMSIRRKTLGKSSTICPAPPTPASTRCPLYSGAFRGWTRRLAFRTTACPRPPSRTSSCALPVRPRPLPRPQPRVMPWPSRPPRPQRGPLPCHWRCTRPRP